MAASGSLCMQRIVLALLCAAPLLLSGCGRVPKATKTRDSGQSGLMDESYAGQNKCNPKRANSPFIIEWDGTDMSSFESYAASDIVFVNYVGCEMTVLDACRNDSIRGEQGAYKPIEWTSGQLERFDIKNTGELYAKLPLGSATLGGRVAGGEHFLMEYYVAGTRTATRDAVYRDDIAKNPACKDATHFVYAYNLGAFALGTTKNFSAEAGGSAFGFGVGGKTTSDSQVDKKGGDLGVCKSDSATEVAGCKAPIRLNLREIYDGQNPDVSARSAPDTDASLNAAGMLAAKQELGERAAALLDAALEKQASGDGKGCLTELDKMDKADPKRKSTEPSSHFSWTRATCLMIAGKCDPGRGLLRKYIERHSPKQAPEDTDNQVSYTAQQYCQGGLGPRDALLKAIAALEAGTVKKQSVQYCADNYALVKKHRGAVKPKDEDDAIINGLPDTLYARAPVCFSKAGDCKKAWEVYVENAPADQKKEKDRAQREFLMRNSFEAYNASCKSSSGPARNPAEQIGPLITGATDKATAGDGKGCLADLDALKAIDAKTEATLSYTRGQCEMLAGKCQAGKTRITNFLKVEKKETAAKAAEGADQAASLYCKGGDMSDRDKLLGAITALGQAMAVEKPAVAACKGPIETIKALAPKVKPRDANDTQVTTAGQLLGTYGPRCLAAAGDCAGARKLLNEAYSDANSQRRRCSRCWAAVLEDGAVLGGDELDLAAQVGQQLGVAEVADRGAGELDEGAARPRGGGRTGSRGPRRCRSCRSRGGRPRGRPRGPGGRGPRRCGAAARRRGGR
jgi:hypothetical protein